MRCFAIHSQPLDSFANHGTLFEDQVRGGVKVKSSRLARVLQSFEHGLRALFSGGWKLRKPTSRSSLPRTDVASFASTTHWPVTKWPSHAQEHCEASRQPLDKHDNVRHPESQLQLGHSFCNAAGRAAEAGMEKPLQICPGM